MSIVLLYYNTNYFTITESTNLSNRRRPFYYCTTTENVNGELEFTNLIYTVVLYLKVIN